MFFLFPKTLFSRALSGHHLRHLARFPLSLRTCKRSDCAFFFLTLNLLDVSRGCFEDKDLSKCRVRFFSSLSDFCCELGGFCRFSAFSNLRRLRDSEYISFIFSTGGFTRPIVSIVRSDHNQSILIFVSPPSSPPFFLNVVEGSCILGYLFF